MTLVNYAKWVDMLMHIHIRAMGKLVNVKVVSRLANSHIATLLLKIVIKREFNIFI